MLIKDKNRIGAFILIESLEFWTNKEKVEDSRDEFLKFLKAQFGLLVILGKL